MNMVVFYGQWIGVCPNLQDVERWGDPNRPRGERVNGLNVDFATVEEARERGWKNESESANWDLATLVAGYFRFYTQHFDVLRGTVSISRGAQSGKYNKSVFPRSKSWRLSVEDPFETYDSVQPHDLGMVIGERGSDVMWEELDRAREITESSWTNLFNSSSTYFNGRKQFKKPATLTDSKKKAFAQTKRPPKTKKEREKGKKEKEERKRERELSKPQPPPLQPSGESANPKPASIKDCAYFLKHGTCKYGDSCKFFHPQKSGIAATEVKDDAYQERLKVKDEKKKKATERRKARRKLVKNAKKEGNAGKGNAGMEEGEGGGVV
ncbi:hypothetical protein TL16_g08409 [Triparma laevis f. inornata]|uniref:C3H1-type domain-containing protein n=1 Tax=Triparma laevis f. inornata TaxID=1714386 RepID=A0A9W7B574_9STRA|nr:hypothetical protein TL16_g08409 [Triparma laevis f. inornata]